MNKIELDDVLDKLQTNFIYLFSGFLIVGLSVGAAWGIIFLASIMISFHSLLLSSILFATFGVCYFVGRRFVKTVKGDYDAPYDR